MRIVVIGGGLGGLATAARLAKNGHRVDLLEEAHELGGALRPVSDRGYTWDASATSTLLPAALRDLFRKTGRPLETELGGDLEPLPVIREHRFEDRTSVRVPGGSRAAQHAAFEELGAGLGEAWVRHVDGYAQVWDVLRRHYVESPWDPADAPRELRSVLDGRETLRRRLRRDLRDDRLALAAGYRTLAEGHDPRTTPSWVALTNYLEQCFGAWRVPGGMRRIADLLTARLATRGVTVHSATPARDLVVRGGRAVAVAVPSGAVDADAVVVAIDPRRLPSLAPLVDRTMPALPPVITHVGLQGALPDLAPEVVLHGDPMLAIRTGGAAPDGGAAWTVHGRGQIAEDLLDALARRRIDLREQVVTRVDLTPRDLAERWGGSPHGVLWQGRGTVRHRLGPRTPVGGVYVAGAHGAPGAGLPFVAQSAALVAQVIGPATR